MGDCLPWISSDTLTRRIEELFVLCWVSVCCVLLTMPEFIWRWRRRRT